MSFFDDFEFQKEDVTVKGKVFNLVEPNALDRIEYFEYLEKMVKGVDDDSPLNTKAKVNTKVNIRLIAICLINQFPDLSVVEIDKLLAKNLTDFEDIEALVTVAEKLTLKSDGVESQDESSDTN